MKDIRAIRRIAHSVFDKHWDKQFPINAGKIAEGVGLRVEHTQGAVLRGRSGYLDREHSTIFINADESDIRQRFTICHELGHYVLGHTGNLNRPADNTYPDASSDIESEANVFAVELLMPDIIVRSLYKNGIGIRAIADALGVSDRILRMRCIELGLA